MTFKASLIIIIDSAKYLREPSFLLARPVFALCVNPQPAEDVHTLPAILVPLV